MEDLSKKTTILFPPKLFAHLSKIAKLKGTSVGSLVRAACEAQYGFASQADRLAAVKELSTLGLPVGDPEELKRQSVPDPSALLPDHDAD